MVYFITTTNNDSMMLKIFAFIGSILVMGKLSTIPEQIGAKGTCQRSYERGTILLISFISMSYIFRVFMGSNINIINAETSFINLIINFEDLVGKDLKFSTKNIYLLSSISYLLWGIYNYSKYKYERLLYPYRDINKLEQDDYIKIRTNVIYSDATTNNSTEENITEQNILDESENRKKILDEALNELNDLVGLDSLKEEVKRFIADICITDQKVVKANYKLDNKAMHMAFLDPPGTGKTTVARIIGRILYGLWFLSTGHTIEADRESLIGEYVGSTAVKTKNLVKSALGGVLFIDEAYSLTPKSNQGFEHEAIDTLVKLIEDNRKDFVVILAGYDKEMKELLKSNTGLNSRIPYKFYFSPYNESELLEITLRNIKSRNYSLNINAYSGLKGYISNLYETGATKNDNARMLRTLFEQIERYQNCRLFNEYGKEVPKEKLMQINSEDIENAVNIVIKNNLAIR